MKLIVGLGNPGEKYKNNRHNVGFHFVEFLAECLGHTRGIPDPSFAKASKGKPVRDDKKNLRQDTGTAPTSPALPPSLKSFGRTSRGAVWKYDKYSNSLVYKLEAKSYKLVIVKPQTYMNRSGDAVTKLVGNWKLEIGNLVVVHDDLDIPLGDFKIQRATGPKLHNGIASIEAALKTKAFTRVRIGVDARGNQKIDGETYVLSDFRPEERKKVEEVFPVIYQRLLTMSSLT